MQSYVKMNLVKFIEFSKILRLPVCSVQFMSGISRPVSERLNNLWQSQNRMCSHCAIALKLHPNQRCLQVQVGNSSSRSKNYSHLVSSGTTIGTSSSSFYGAFVKYNKTKISLWRQEFSSIATTVDGGFVNSIEDELTHPGPGGPTENEVSQDPELLSVLSEIASDFGKSNHGVGTESRGTVTNMTKDETGSDNLFNSADTSRENVDVKEGFVVMTTEKDVVQMKKESTADAETLISTTAEESQFVFSIDEIVGILQEENAQDICVIKVPPEKNYVDYFIVVTGRSTRHLNAMTQYINKMYKQRKRNSDPFLIMEGKLSDDWMCLDFGNFVIHMMLEDTRSLYDLEQLWTLGKEFDEHIQQWEQHEIMMFNPETDLQIPESEDGNRTLDK